MGLFFNDLQKGEEVGGKGVCYNRLKRKHRWLIPIFLVTCKGKMEEATPGQPGHIVHEIPSPK
jgi:hypothetical protein